MSKMPFRRELSAFYHFDNSGALHLPELKQCIHPGESVALLGARGTDVSDLYNRFNTVDPLSQPFGDARTPPTIWCVTRDGSLFLDFSAYDNFTMAEKRVFPYSRSELVRTCNELKEKFGFSADLTVPLKQLSVSQRIIIDILRPYLAGASVLVCDNLYSPLENTDRAVLLRIAEDITSRGCSILYLTTKWESAVQIASRIAVFSEKTLLGEADTQSVMQNPQHLIYLMSGKDLMQQYNSPSQTSQMLSMLYSGAEYLTNNMELRGALAFVLKNANNLLRCTACSIHLLDSKDRSLRVFSFPDLSTAPLFQEEFVYQLMEGKAKPFPYYLNNEDINFSRIFRVRPDRIQAILCMPVTLGANVKGLFSVYFDHSIIYDEEQYLYIKSFCKETAIIIETSRLLGNSVLLQESNHRIKNNLQVVVNLISTQKLFAAQNPHLPIDMLLESIVSRVQNIALAHEILSSRDSIGGSIELKKMIRHIIRPICTADVSVEIHCDDILVPYNKATSISMIINELVSNCFKYAFPVPTPDDRVCIDCTLYDGVLEIAVRDNGVGFDRGAINAQSPACCGFSIIQAIVGMDLGGSFHMESSTAGTMAMFSASLL